jgi:glutaredoxin
VRLGYVCGLGTSLTHPHRLDEVKEGSEIQEYLQQKTGQRTVPNIFISTYTICCSAG